MADRNFDSIAQKFVNNIYGTTKGKIRSEIVWQEVQHCLTLLPNRPLRILDAGGGFGFFSQKLAILGHQVILCDISGELLKVAENQLIDKSYANNIEIIHSSIQDLKLHVDGQFDLILNHAVLEWLDDPRETLKGLLDFLAPDGILSLMFYNREAQRFFNLVSGNFEFVANNMITKKVVKLTPTHPLLESDVKNWLSESCMQTIRKTGIRVLHDYLKDKTLCDQKLDMLLAMEQQYCHQEPYASLGRYTHLTVKGMTE